MPQTKPPLSPSKSRPSVRWRSIAIGLLLIPINCYWITYIELVQYSAQPTIVSLIFTVVFNVLVLIGFNQILKRFLPRLALSQGELLVIYVMLSVASATAGHSMMEILVSTLGHAFWFATPENDWKDLFWRYIPRWLAVADKDVLSGYYEGDSTLHTKQHLLGWLTPVMSWFAFLFAMLFVMVCITLIVRKPWTEDEKLAYPIIQLPARMTSEGFFTNRLMRMKFFWSPFHPAAYAAVCGSWAVNYIWFTLLVAWGLKLVLLKYGGRNAHRKAMPFFLGLILGQFTVGSLWTILGMVFNIPTYGIWP